MLTVLAKISKSMKIYSLSPVLGGEGRGEGRVFKKSPLTLTLSPEYKGEGIS